MTRIHRPVPRRAAAVVVALAAVVTAVVPAGAHAPDPIFSGGPFGQNQELRYRWRESRVPPAAMRTAIHAAAADSNESRLSRSATFAYDADGPSWIMYGSDVGCSAAGIACFTRSAPTSFTMSFRANGHRFDWGTLRWCQLYDPAPDGCFDAENIALDEFGHVEILAHHVNRTDDSDYLDAVVQTVSRAKPRTGWNVHRYGRCDVAALQSVYDVASSFTPISTCLELPTVVSLTASSSVRYDGPATFNATLTVTSSSSVPSILRNNALSARRVVLQRRPSGGTWSTIAAFEPGSKAGTYTLSLRLRSTAEFRAAFWTPSDEGLIGDTSPSRTVTVSGGCTGAPCPLFAEP